VKVGDLVRMRPDVARVRSARRNPGSGVGLIVEHQGETKGWEDCYYKIMWSGPWFTWEDVCNLEVVK
jgi:hypothetical protein